LNRPQMRASRDTPCIGRKCEGKRRRCRQKQMERGVFLKKIRTVFKQRPNLDKKIIARGLPGLPRRIKSLKWHLRGLLWGFCREEEEVEISAGRVDVFQTGQKEPEQNAVSGGGGTEIEKNSIPCEGGGLKKNSSTRGNPRIASR